MNLQQNIIVLTATVDPSVGKAGVVLTDKFERLNQYLENIRNLILNSDFSRIVFCENSNYQYDYSNLSALATEHGKELEVLSFMGSNDVITVKGKSYGEGEILNFAVNSSLYLKNDNTTFYKLTGRIYVANINRILAETGHENVFIRWDIRKNEVDTRFFKSQVGFFKKNLSGVLDAIDDGSGHSIEEVYFDVLKGDPAVFSFKSYPVITGICASLGRPYDLGMFKLLYRKLQLQAGLLDLHSCSRNEILPAKAS